MSLYHRNLATLNRAQEAYDYRSPPEPGISPCEKCDGKGWLMNHRISANEDEDESWEEDCPDCDGLGGIDDYTGECVSWGD